MSEETIENITKSDIHFAPTFFDDNVLPHINLNRHCLMKSTTSVFKKLINIYISDTLNPCLRNLNTN